VAHAGETIIAQGEIGEEFFIIEDGEAIVYRKTDLDDEAEEPKELARLSAPAYFGEIALVTSEPRSATIVASRTLYLLKMNARTFNRVLATSQILLTEARITRGREIIGDIPIFKCLSKEEQGKLFGSMRAVNYKKGTYICEQGSAGVSFYVVVEGSCAVTTNREGGKEIGLGQLLVDDYFGELSLIDEKEPRSANVITESDTTCMSLSRTAFEAFLTKVRPMHMEQSAMKILLETHTAQEVRPVRSPPPSPNPPPPPPPPPPTPRFSSF